MTHYLGSKPGGPEPFLFFSLLMGFDPLLQFRGRELFKLRAIFYAYFERDFTVVFEGVFLFFLPGFTPI